MEHNSIQEILDMNSINQSPSYSVEYKDNVYSVLTHDVKKKLSIFLETFNVYRRDNGLFNIKTEEFKKLPRLYTRDRQIWKARRRDLQLITALLENTQSQNVLDLGSWNGWLSNRLSELNHEVVAVDYFLHELGGLKSKKYYPNDWHSIQMDLNDLHLFSIQFNLIVVNRCLAYWPDPMNKLKQLIALLAPGGKIIITGLNLLLNEELFKSKFEQLNKTYTKQYHQPMLFNETKGYLNLQDGKNIESLGFQLSPYEAQGSLELLKKWIKPPSAQFMYAIYES